MYKMELFLWLVFCVCVFWRHPLQPCFHSKLVLQYTAACIHICNICMQIIFAFRKKMILACTYGQLGSNAPKEFVCAKFVKTGSKHRKEIASRELRHTLRMVFARILTTVLG